MVRKSYIKVKVPNSSCSKHTLRHRSISNDGPLQIPISSAASVQDQHTYVPQPLVTFARREAVEQRMLFFNIIKVTRPGMKLVSRLPNSLKILLRYLNTAKKQHQT